MTIALKDRAKEIKKKFKQIESSLNERTRRIWVATEALSLGRGGISLLQKITGISRPTIYAGIEELSKKKTKKIATDKRIRKEGGGAKKISEKHPEILPALENLVEPTAKGDPMTMLRWSSKSLRRLSDALKTQGFSVGHNVVGDLLKELDYSLQLNRKEQEGSSVSREERDAQFMHINETAGLFLQERCPVLSVDTKKKELIGNYKNSGREYKKTGQPEEVNVHDFPGKEGKVIPYGVYDIGKNKGWVSVGMTSDTATFAVNAIRSWWSEMGEKEYGQISKLMITADCGGSNGYRVRLWKWELQKLANELNAEIHVLHFPPGTSKWNKIEHKMFSYITQNWRGKPLITKETVVKLIGNTTTTKGLEIKAQLDCRTYNTGIEVDDETFNTICITHDDLRGNWNYKISPMKNEKFS